MFKRNLKQDTSGPRIGHGNLSTIDQVKVGHKKGTIVAIPGPPKNFLGHLNLPKLPSTSELAACTSKEWPANERPFTSQKDLLFCNLNFRVTTHLPTDSI